MKILLLILFVAACVGCLNVNRGSQKVTNIYRLFDSQVTMYEDDTTTVAADKEYHDSGKIDFNKEK